MLDANTTEPDALKWLIFTSIKGLKSELEPRMAEKGFKPDGLVPLKSPIACGHHSLHSGTAGASGNQKRQEGLSPEPTEREVDLSFRLWPPEWGGSRSLLSQAPLSAPAEHTHHPHLDESPLGHQGIRAPSLPPGHTPSSPGQEPLGA